ncbi:hypothetical protein LB507_006719 [Fusarium sp. FIESC RH6]|nr:hypothetical protein LB507_006719 [Fusarium sp. FIESC RH6]
MSFFDSCQDIQIIDGHILRALAQDADGQWRESQIDLDQFIGNQDGWFMWGGEFFSKSAMNVELEGTYLMAELTKADGDFGERQGIDLNDRISNENGELVFI